MRDRLELLCRHIPDRYEHLVRYCGWYSNRSRGARAVKVAAPATISSGVTEVLNLERVKTVNTINIFVGVRGFAEHMEDRVVRGLTIIAIAVSGGTLTIIAALMWRRYLLRLQKTGWEAFEQKDYAAAERRLLAFLRGAKSYGTKSMWMANALFDLAVFYSKRERLEEAVTMCERAVASAEGAADARDPFAIAARILLARLYFRLELLTAAENTCRRVLEDAFATHGQNDSRTAGIAWLLGRILLARGGREEGAALLSQALDIWDHDFEQDPEELARCFEDYAGFLREIGRTDEADGAASRAAELAARRVN